MWLASPGNSSYELCGVGSVGAIWTTGGSISNNLGVRPIICLKDTVKLEKQDDGNYKLVQ